MPSPYNENGFAAYNPSANTWIGVDIDTPMKAFLPIASTTRSPRDTVSVISSNATYLSTKATAEAVRATTAAAAAMLAQTAEHSVGDGSSSIGGSASPTPRSGRRSTGQLDSSTKSGMPSLKNPRQNGSYSHMDANAVASSGTARSTGEHSTGGDPVSSNNSGGEVEIFPAWIRERKDFQVFFPRYSDRVITDEEILRQGVPKEPSERNIVELQCIARWIMKIPSMASSLDLSQATEIAKLARYHNFKPREFVFRKGDKGDACYLIFSGEVHVLIDGAKVASVGKNAAFGDIALQIENATRGADVQAGSNSIGTGCEVLMILAQDYHKTLARCQSRRRKHLITWLHTDVTLFRDCAESKLHFFELVSIDVPLKKDEVLYRQGDSIGAFYVVRSGRVRIEVDIRYEHRHRWPCGKHEWKQEMHAIKSRVPFQTEGASGFFGFEMFIEGEQTRSYTVVADTPTVELVALNRVDCFSPYFSFTPRSIEKIVEKHDKCRDLARHHIQRKLKDFHYHESKQKRVKSHRSAERAAVKVQPRFAASTETPQFQFPRLEASSWEADNDAVRALQRACM